MSKRRDAFWNRPFHFRNVPLNPNRKLLFLDLTVVDSLTAVTVASRKETCPIGSTFFRYVTQLSFGMYGMGHVSGVSK
jgi:hypothetical protein